MCTLNCDLVLEGNGTTTTEFKSDEEKMLEFILAAKNSDSELMTKLIEGGGIDLDGRDEEGRTALHWVVSLPCPCGECAKKAEHCLFLLVKTSGLKIDVNIQDNLGLTPLHIAAESQLGKCCKILIFHGADVYKCSNAGVLAISLISKRVPDIMVYLLNESISMDGSYIMGERVHSTRCSLSMDFRVILGNMGNNQRVKMIDFPEEYDSCDDGLNEMRLLRSLLHSSKSIRAKFFTHPTVTIFLHQKWRRVRKYFILTFIFYAIWLLLFTGYIVMTYLINCPCTLFTEQTTFKSIVKKSERLQQFNTSESWNTDSDTDKSHQGSCMVGLGTNAELTIFIILITITVLMGMNEIAKLLVTPKLYMKNRLNILHWCLLLLSLLTYIPSYTKQTQISSQQYQIAALAIFLAWALILFHAGKFPSIGIYLEIFGHVLKQFWFFLLTYLSLFIAFALAFSILFPGNEPYTIFPFAFLKIFVMMVGEMEYQDVFYDEATGRASGPIIGHLLYATFIVVVAIVLMNLLIGLTVSDIRGLQKEAEMNRVSRQIIDMFHLESFLFSNKIPYCIKKRLHRLTSVAVQLGRTQKLNDSMSHSGSNSQSFLTPSNKYVFKFLPNDSRDKSVPEKMKEAALELAIKLESDRNDKVCVRPRFFGRGMMRGGPGGPFDMRGRGRGGERGGQHFTHNMDPRQFLTPPINPFFQMGGFNAMEQTMPTPPFEMKLPFK